MLLRKQSFFFSFGNTDFLIIIEASEIIQDIRTRVVFNKCLQVLLDYSEQRQAMFDDGRVHGID